MRLSVAVACAVAACVAPAFADEGSNLDQAMVVAPGDAPSGPAVGTPLPSFAVGPETGKPSSKSAPTIQSVTARIRVRTAQGVLLDVVPDVHFIAPKGNAIVLRRELVETNGPFSQTQLRNATINIPPEGQKHGATISGGWRCGVQPYYVTIRATVMDADGERSNPVTYTIHCNGG